MIKNPPANAGRCKRHCFVPWVRKIPWSRAWQPTPVFLPGESPWTEEPGGLPSKGSQRVQQDLTTEHKAGMGRKRWIAHGDISKLSVDSRSSHPGLDSSILQ